MRVVLIGFFFSSAFLAISCKQGNGDRCVQNSDCSSNICVGAGIQGGHCAASATNETGTGGSRATGGQSGNGGEAGQGGVGGEAGASPDAAPASDAAQDAAHDGPTGG